MLRSSENGKVFCEQPWNEREDTQEIIGRGDRIRTYDPLRPRQVRYQAALRPDITAVVILNYDCEVTNSRRFRAHTN